MKARYVRSIVFSRDCPLNIFKLLYLPINSGTWQTIICMYGVTFDRLYKRREDERETNVSIHFLHPKNIPQAVWYPDGYLVDMNKAF